MERVSIFNCVSNALNMLEFSSDAILLNAGYDNFDYIVVTWGPSPAVKDYLNKLQFRHKNVHVVEYETNHEIPFVPNLRGMMNKGFDYGFQLNDYCGLTNTDQYFGKDWLLNLVKYANPNDIVNSVHISPIEGPNIVTANLGKTEYGTFLIDDFNRMYDELYEDRLITEADRGGDWRAINTMPYLIPKRFWEIAGPWELMLGAPHSPDVRFFQRCKDAGANFTMSLSSIAYHHNATERTQGKRPDDAANMTDE